MKKCSSCKTEKELIEFYIHKKYKDGYSYECKNCVIIRSKKYRENNKNKIIVRKQEKYILNKEYILSKSNDYYSKNKNKILLKRKLPLVKERIRKNKHYRIHNDICFKLACRLRGRLNSALKNKYKKGSAIRDLGCSIHHLKLHLELFWDEGMTWDNYGNKEGQWSIDHIKPLSKFDLTDRDQLLEAVNFRNLQPLWHVDNLRKLANA